MCSILREVEAEGMQEGIQIGMQKGIQKGRQEGEQKKEIEIIKTLMIKNNCSIDEAMNLINIPEEKQSEYIKIILK